MRHKARVDDNQPEIVRAFRRLGCSVAHTHQLGKGFPDLIIGFMKKNFLIEIKDGSKIPSKQKLTDDELEFHNAWLGNIHIIKSEDEAIDLVNRIRAAGW